MAIRVTLPEKDEDTDDPSPAESLQMAVRVTCKSFMWSCEVEVPDGYLIFFIDDRAHEECIYFCHSLVPVCITFDKYLPVADAICFVFCRLPSVKINFDYSRKRPV